MERVLAWKAHLRIAAAGDDTLFVVGEGEQFMLRGRAYVLAGELVDGVRTVGDVVRAAGAHAAELLYALRMLEMRGYVAEAVGAGATGAAAAAFWQALGSDARVVEARLAERSVAVVGDERGMMRAALAGAGVRVSDEAGLTIVVDGYASRAAAHAGAGPWLPVRLTGLSPWLGPWLGTAGGACWHCLEHRLAWNQPVERWLARGGVEVATVHPSLPASEQVAANLAALTIAWWLADGGVGAIDDHLLAFSLTELRASKHRVVRRPQCPACGDGGLIAARSAQPIKLVARPRSAATDGGHRIVGPEATVAQHEHHVSPITGVIASIGPVPGRDHPLRPVAGAVYRVTPRSRDVGFDDFHRMSSGKGATPMQAKASALCEALERISAIWQGDEVAVRGPFGAECVHPDALQNFSAAQFATRDPELRGKHRVPRPYGGEAIAWTPAWSLTHDARVYVPTDYCYQHTDTLDADAVCVFNPNGHAAGNCLEEAVLQGFLELVERDAIALWWYGRLRVPGVDLAAFGDPYFVALRDHYATLGYAVRVLDVTTDLAIPVFVAIAERADGGRHAIGFGCHLDARLGVQRALTELNQIFAPDEATPAAWDPRALVDDGFLHGDATLAPRVYEAVTSTDVRDDVWACVARAAVVGLDVIVLDQTRPDLGLSAAKVVIPGLRHFWPRFGPGRLYDVPAARGVALTEADLNPVPLLL